MGQELENDSAEVSPFSPCGCKTAAAVPVIVFEFQVAERGKGCKTKGTVHGAGKRTFLNKPQKVSGYNPLGRNVSGGWAGWGIQSPQPVKAGSLSKDQRGN